MLQTTVLRRRYRALCHIPVAGEPRPQLLLDLELGRAVFQADARRQLAIPHGPLKNEVTRVVTQIEIGGRLRWLRVAIGTPLSLSLIHI